MISDEYKFVFILLPKTGTTSIVRSIHKLGNKVDKNKFWAAEKHYDKIENNHLDYLKVATCRNPYSRCISIWKYWNSRFNQIKAPTVSFPYFMSRFLKIKNNTINTFGILEEIHFTSLVEGVSLATGGILSHIDIDFWIKFESLQEDFNIFLDKTGLQRRQLPHKNATQHRHYVEYYDDETREIVAEKYAKDINYFGYKFGE